MCACDDGLVVGKTGRMMRFAATQFSPDTGAAFADGESMQTTSLALECAVTSVAGSGRIVGVNVYEQASTVLKLPMRFYLLAAEQTGLTLHTAYVAPNPLTNILGKIEVAVGDWITVSSGRAMAQVSASVDFKLPLGTTLYLLPVARGAGTYAAGAAVTIQLIIQSD